MCVFVGMKCVCVCVYMRQIECAWFTYTDLWLEFKAVMYTKLKYLVNVVQYSHQPDTEFTSHTNIIPSSNVATSIDFSGDYLCGVHNRLISKF